MARLILASLRRGRGLYGIWILSLALAVTGLVIIDVYRSSLAEMIRQQGRKILTADISVGARRLLSEEERQQFIAAIPQPARFSETIEMMAMVSGPAESRLANLRFIEDGYPLVGDLEVGPGADSVGRPVLGDSLSAPGAPLAWVAPDLLVLMNLQPGARLKIGGVEFSVAGVIRKDSSQTVRFGALAPRVYVHKNYLSASGLVQFGSTFSNTIYAVSPGVDSAMAERLEKNFRDPGVEVTSPRELERGALRMLTRILDYLGLIGLVTLSLGWVGVFYLGRRWLTAERRTGAILKCMGFSSSELERLWLSKLTVILCAGVALGGLVSWIGAHAAFPLIKSSLPEEFSLTWSWTNTSLLLLTGPLAGVLLLYGPLRTSANEAPLTLLSTNPPRLRINPRMLAALAFCIVLLFTIITLLQARSWRVTGIFLTSLASCVGIIAGSTFLALRATRTSVGQTSGWMRHLTAAQWVRRPGTAVLLVTVSALAGLLAQMIPHLERTLIGGLEAPSATERPSLFLFDVQQEQVDPLTRFLENQEITSAQTSPFIRSRLLKVNGTDYERRKTGEWATREEETEARFRNRGVNLSYRAELSASERIVEGKSWVDMSDGEVSVEKEYAARMCFHLQDRLLFDIQGIEAEAKVVSFRVVNWDSFQPNFFVQFKNAGILSEAPKTWIMTLKRHERMNTPQMQRLITSRFANVSSINVEEALDNLTGIISKLSAGLQVASRLAMALGVFVFLMILLFQLSASQADWTQLRVLGLTPVQVWSLQLAIYGGLAVVGTIYGTVLAAAANWALARFAFGADVRFDLASVTAVLLITWAFAVLGLTLISFRQNAFKGLRG